MLWRSLDTTKVSDYDEFLKQEPENVRSLQSLRLVALGMVKWWLHQCSRTVQLVSIFFDGNHQEAIEIHIKRYQGADIFYRFSIGFPFQKISLWVVGIQGNGFVETQSSPPGPVWGFGGPCMTWTLHLATMPLQLQENQQPQHYGDEFVTPRLPRLKFTWLNRNLGVPTSNWKGLSVVDV